MEWWQSGLSALAGVIVGGLFTYLGLRKQLEQQKDINEKEWKRKIRSEPLLKLRAELVIMATKLERLASTAHKLHTRFGESEDEVKEELQKNVDDVNSYIASGSFMQTLFMQYDKKLRDAVEEIVKDYRASVRDALYYFDELKANERGEATQVFERNKARIIDVQELINKKLEEL